MFANGGIFSYSDVQACLEYTKCDGVMVGAALIENPALFSGRFMDLDQLSKQYLDIAENNMGECHTGMIKAHLFKMWFSVISQNNEARYLLE